VFSTQDVLVGIVIEIDQFIAPPNEHWLPRGQNNSNAGAQALRPQFNRPQGCFGPVNSAHERTQFSSPCKQDFRGQGPVGRLQICLIFVAVSIERNVALLVRAQMIYLGGQLAGRPGDACEHNTHQGGPGFQPLAL
jgi:hypothetical protein